MTEGYCVKVISGQEYIINEENTINGKTWWEVRPAMILVPAESWAHIKAFIIKICNSTKQCTKEVGTWERSVQNVDSKLIQKQGSDK